MEKKRSEEIHVFVFITGKELSLLYSFFSIILFFSLSILQSLQKSKIHFRNFVTFCVSNLNKTLKCYRGQKIPVKSKNVLLKTTGLNVTVFLSHILSLNAGTHCSSQKARITLNHVPLLQLLVCRNVSCIYSPKVNFFEVL